MKLCRCACGCSAAPLLRSRSAPFRAELRAVRTFAAGAPASDRSAHSVPAGSRTGSVGGALNRIAFGLRRSGKIPFGMLPSDRVQAGNPFGDRRCGKIPPSFPKKNRFDKLAQSRTGVWLCRGGKGDRGKTSDRYSLLRTEDRVCGCESLRRGFVGRFRRAVGRVRGGRGGGA